MPRRPKLSETFGQKPVGGDGGGGIPSLYLSFRIFISDTGCQLRAGSGQCCLDVSHQLPSALSQPTLLSLLLWAKLYLPPLSHTKNYKNLNAQDLRIQPYLDIGSLQIELVKMRSHWRRVPLIQYDCALMSVVNTQTPREDRGLG